METLLAQPLLGRGGRGAEHSISSGLTLGFRCFLEIPAWSQTLALLSKAGRYPQRAADPDSGRMVISGLHVCFGWKLTHPVLTCSPRPGAPGPEHLPQEVPATDLSAGPTGGAGSGACRRLGPGPVASPRQIGSQHFPQAQHLTASLFLCT